MINAWRKTEVREAYVLYRLGFVRTDELPDLAARWLAADLVDNESVRLLAGHDPHDPAMLDTLIADSVTETGLTIPTESAQVRDIAVDWVTSTWRHTGNTRWAVSTLARLGETYPEFDLGLWIGLDDERNGGWGTARTRPQGSRKERTGLLHPRRLECGRLLTTLSCRVPIATDCHGHRIVLALDHAEFRAFVGAGTRSRVTDDFRVDPWSISLDVPREMIVDLSRGWEGR